MIENFNNNIETKLNNLYKYGEKKSSSEKEEDIMFQVFDKENMTH